MAKESRDKKMYKNSPRIERDEETGKPTLKKGPKEGADAPKTDGEPDTSPSDDIAGMRMQEIKDMHKRHQSEMKNIYNRHAKEDGKSGSADTQPDDGE